MSCFTLIFLPHRLLQLSLVCVSVCVCVWNSLQWAPGGGWDRGDEACICHSLKPQMKTSVNDVITIPASSLFWIKRWKHLPHQRNLSPAFHWQLSTHRWVGTKRKREVAQRGWKLTFCNISKMGNERQYPFQWEITGEFQWSLPVTLSTQHTECNDL